jgi:hypothetical protein
LGYDADRMAFEFTMLNKDETVPFEISNAAMDELAGKRGTLPAEREAQFLHLRETIERIASDNFDREPVVRDAVVAFSQSIFEVRHSPSIIQMTTLDVSSSELCARVSQL